MTPAEFVERVLCAQRDEIERRLRALEVGESLCVHEHDWRGEYFITVTAHTVTRGRSCAAAGRRSVYGPMTAELKALASELAAQDG